MAQLCLVFGVNIFVHELVLIDLFITVTHYAQYMLTHSKYRGQNKM